MVNKNLEFDEAATKTIEKLEIVSFNWFYWILGVLGGTG